MSLSLLNTLQVAGGGSEADASSAPMAEASGTGLSLDGDLDEPVPDQRHVVPLGRRARQPRRTPSPRATARRRRRPGATIARCPSTPASSTSTSPAGTPRRPRTPTATRPRPAPGSLANVSVSLSLSRRPASILGGSLPSASLAVRGRAGRDDVGGLQLEPPVGPRAEPARHGQRDPAGRPSP